MRYHRLMSFKQNNQYGGISVSIVVIIILGLLLAGTGGFALWLFGQYTEQSQTIEERIESEKSTAVNERAKEDEAKYLELSKQPLLNYTGPDEYGRVTFDYPRNWDLYVDSDGLDRKALKLYLNPGFVPPVSDIRNRFAIRVKVEQGSVDEYLQTFKNQITKGTVKTSAVTINKHDATRIDGEVAKDIRGSVVVFKVDDNILTVQTDADTFKSDFDKLIATIDFK
jgi:hypothetical protein